LLAPEIVVDERRRHRRVAEPPHDPLGMRIDGEDDVGDDPMTQAGSERAVDRHDRSGEVGAGETLEAGPSHETRTRSDHDGGVPRAKRDAFQLEQRVADARSVQLGVREAGPADTLQSCRPEPRGDAPTEAHRVAHARRTPEPGAGTRRVRIFAGATPNPTSSATCGSGRSKVAMTTASSDSSASSATGFTGMPRKVPPPREA